MPASSTTSVSGQAASPGGLVDVAANRRYRRDCRKLLKNLGRAYVSRVNDVLGPAQRLQRFGTKQPVRVGDDADQNGRSQSLRVSS